MTWIMLGAAAISAAGAVGSAALSKGGGGGMVAAPQMPQDQKTAPTKPTAEGFKLPPPGGAQTPQVQMPAPQQPMPAQPAPAQPLPSGLQSMVMPPQNASLADFLKYLNSGGA